MNINLLKRNEKECDVALVQNLSKKLNLHKRLTELLVSRGFDSVEKIEQYLHPDENNFYDPFLLKGMTSAVERIQQAIKNNEKVVIYGDYDADGICSAAILALYLSKQGLEVYPHIPSRVGDGYGLNVESIEKIIEQCCPDLILTCDCGISGSVEVEYAMDLGVDVIVTDHHEVSESIPNCIVINPKQSDCNYPYAYLCGAGVVLKLVQALGGLDAAKEYLDLAAIATVADLVPLLDENRLIVQTGLKKLSEKHNLGLSLLLKSQNLPYPITSADIAYKIAPRINAAGRMGDAYRAFELLTLQDPKKLDEIIVSINSDNNKRKELCDILYDEAVVDLQYEDLVNERAIILSNPSWEKGITGILAARLAGDFKRPTFIMVNSGGQYKGTSRSIAGINIYELLDNVKDCLVEFGGHSQAAGFSIKEGDIPTFKKKVFEYLKQFPQTLFEQSLEYDLEVPLVELDLDLAKALENIEPSGNSNSRPLFKSEAINLKVAPCKSNVNHTNITTSSGLELIAFNFYSQNQFLLGDDKKELVVELQLNSFAGRETAKGILKGVCNEKLYVNNDIAKANFLKNLAFLPSKTAKFSTYDFKQLNNIVGNDIFGTLIIAGCEESYNNFISQSSNKELINEFIYITNKNNYSRIIISPEIDDNLLLSNYKKIIFLDSPPGNAIVAYFNKKTKATIYLPKESNENIFYKNLKIDRLEFGRYYEAIRANSNLQANNIMSYFKMLSSRLPNLNAAQFVACIMVFSQLKLMTITKKIFSIQVNLGVKIDLTESSIYNYLKEAVETNK